MEMVRLLLCSFALLLMSFACNSDAGDVTYDGRSLIINGERKVLFSGSIHYPRSAPEVNCIAFLSIILLFNFISKFYYNTNSGLLACSVLIVLGRQVYRAASSRFKFVFSFSFSTFFQILFIQAKKSPYNIKKQKDSFYIFDKKPKEIFVKAKKMGISFLSLIEKTLS